MAHIADRAARNGDRAGSTHALAARTARFDTVSLGQFEERALLLCPSSGLARERIADPKGFELTGTPLLESQRIPLS